VLQSVLVSTARFKIILKRFEATCAEKPRNVGSWRSWNRTYFGL